jgi:hypothetical protein
MCDAHTAKDISAYSSNLRPVAAQSRALFAAADGGDQGKDWSASRRGEKCGCCAVDIRIKNRGGVNIY